MTYHDDDDDASGARRIDDRELPDASDMDDPDDEDSAETIPCPNCRWSVYEAAERCPHCGAYLSEEDAPRRHPWWLVAGVLVLVAIILLAWLR